MRLDDGKSVNEDAPISRLNNTMIESADQRKDSHRLGSSPLIVSEKILKIESEKKEPIK